MAGIDFVASGVEVFALSGQCTSASVPGTALSQGLAYDCKYVELMSWF